MDNGRRYRVQRLDKIYCYGKAYKLPREVWVYYDDVNIMQGYRGYNDEYERIYNQIFTELKDEYGDHESIQAIKQSGWVKE